MEDSIIERYLNEECMLLPNKGRDYPAQRRVFKIDIANIDPKHVEEMLTGVKVLVQAHKPLDQIKITFPDLNITEESSLIKSFKELLQELEDRKATKEEEQLGRDTTAIANVLRWLKDDGMGLEVEVIYFALKFMQEDPKLSIMEAIYHGFNEWDK